MYNYSSSGPVGLENVVSSIRFKRYTGYSEVDGKREYDDYTGSSSGLINTIHTTSSTCATFDDVYWMERPSEIVSSGYTSSLNVFESSDTESIVDTLNADTAKEVDWMIKTVTEDGLPVQIPWIAD